MRIKRLLPFVIAFMLLLSLSAISEIASADIEHYPQPPPDSWLRNESIGIAGDTVNMLFYVIFVVLFILILIQISGMGRRA